MIIGYIELTWIVLAATLVIVCATLSFAMTIDEHYEGE